MHVTTDQVLAVVAALNFVATILLHFRKTQKVGAEVQSVADEIKGDAPEIAQAADEAITVANGIVREVK